jgi:hypothetical protein
MIGSYAHPSLARVLERVGIGLPRLVDRVLIRLNREDKLSILQKLRFAADSPVEGAGFELLVPPSKRTAVPELARSFFAASYTGCDCLVSEDADFEL